MGRLSVFSNWTKYERPFMNVFCTYIFGLCVYWVKQKRNNKNEQELPVMLTKEYEQTNTFMRIMLMTNITQDILIRDSFHNRSGVLVRWKNVWANSYEQMYKVLQQNNLFCLKMKLDRKGNVQHFWLHSVILFTKFD